MQDLFLSYFDSYSDELYRYCQVRVRDADLAQDLVQTAFEKLWLVLRKGKSIEQPRPFLYRILSNLIVDHFRKKKTDSLEALMETGRHFSDEQSGPSLQRRLDHERIVQCVELLSPQDAHLVTLRFLGDLSLQELADRLGISVNAASVRLTRALAKLRSILTPFYEKL